MVLLWYISLPVSATQLRLSECNGQSTVFWSQKVGLQISALPFFSCLTGVSHLSSVKLG